MEIYPELLNEYLNFCLIKEAGIKNKQIDLSNLSWIYPTEILPLVAFIKKNNNLKLVNPKDQKVKNYFDKVLNDKLDNSSSIYLPCINLPKTRKEANLVIERLQRICEDGKNLGGIQAFGYFLSEVIDNVYEHSNFSQAYIFAQSYPKKKFSEISIIDDGISIPGSYEKANYKFSEEEAMFKALEGISTKDKERGFGLRTNVSLFTKGLKGEVLIVSRGIALYVSETNKKLFKLQNQQSLQGTFISVRLPYPAKEVNIYEYV